MAKTDEPTVGTEVLAPEDQQRDLVPEDIRLPPIAELDRVFKEHAERQDHFKKLILSRLVKGRDYGFPPGCEQKYDEQGNILTFNKRSQGWEVVPKDQWQAKPSLYVSGALELRDLFKMLGFPVRVEYDRDLDAKIAKSRCKMYHEISGKVIGEGAGAYRIGQKGADENTAIQMADNRALKAAVRRTFPCCASLFTQDEKDPNGKPPEAPDEDKFTKLVNEWVRESVGPSSPLYGHRCSEAEIHHLRRQLNDWTKPKQPDTPEKALEWLKEHAQVAGTEDEEGAITGIRFESKGGNS